MRQGETGTNRNAAGGCDGMGVVKDHVGEEFVVERSLATTRQK
jgi:hypothetical protein